MSLAVALLAFATVPQLAPAGAPPAIQAADPGIETAARDWLALVDDSRWEESWAATARSFQQLNTTATWAAASKRVRVPLGAVRSRTLIGQEEVPTPPDGHQLVKFRTDFANRPGAVETVSLVREGGRWRIAGIYVS